MDHLEAIVSLNNIVNPDFSKKIVSLIDKKAKKNLKVGSEGDELINKKVRNVKGYQLNFDTPRNEFYWNLIKKEIERLYVYYTIKFPKMSSNKINQIDLLKYRVGGKYEVHIDHFSTTTRCLSVIINLNDISELERITSSFNNSLSYPHMVMTWKEKNQALFSWLNIQRWPILFIFGLIALVGIVNIISSLAMIIIDKSRQIGILKSLGMKKSQLKLTFLIQGLIIGIIGSLIGSVISLIIAWLQNSYKIIQVPEDIYFMDFIPIDINFSHILFISLLAIFFSIFAAIWPSIKIDKIKSSEALKYE